MSWRPIELLVEALRNLVADQRRAGLVTIVIALVMGGSLAAELWQIGSVVSLELARQERGEYVVSVRSESGLAPGRCQSVARLRGITRAGGVQILEPVELGNAPGRLVQATAVDAGVVALWNRGAVRRAPDGVLVGSELAADLGLEEGSRVLLGASAPQVSVLDVSARHPAAAGWIMFLSPTIHPDECWIEFAPGVETAGVEMLSSHFWTEGAAISVRPLRSPTDETARPPALLSSRATQHLWLPAAGIVIVVLWVVTWTRRRDIGLYRSLGASPFDLLILGTTETHLLVVIGALLGWVWAVAAFACLAGPEFGLDVTLVATRSWASEVALVLLVAPLPWFASRRDTIVDQLKAD